ncbi:MAG TPA: hypothetical protein VLH13_04515, partial [Methanomassiliicoccales archaeon]|nr:hypothetical protein [Methanomassiliicoccales archaeon]
SRWHIFLFNKKRSETVRPDVKKTQLNGDQEISAPVALIAVDRRWMALAIVAMVVFAGISLLLMLRSPGNDDDIITTNAEAIRVHLEDLPTGFGLIERTNGTVWPPFYRSVAMWEFFQTGALISYGTNFVGVGGTVQDAVNVTANLRTNISALGELTDLGMGDESFQCHPTENVAYYVVRENNVVFYVTVSVTDATIPESAWISTLLNGIYDRI